MQGKTIRITPASVLLLLVLLVFIFVALLPLYWMALSSITPQHQLFSVPPAYRPDVTFGNYLALVQQLPFLSYLRNSIFFAVGSVIVSVVLSFLAAYGFARIEVPFSNAILLALVLSMALPPIVTVVPLFQLLRNAGMIDTIRGLVTVMSSVLIPFSVWVLVTFVKRVPVEMEEAAIVDGARLPQVLWYVVVPVMAPALATIMIINFINAWNNLLFPLVFTNSVDAKTLTVSLTEVFQARNPFGRPWGLISALGVTMVVPIVGLVLLAQRAIVSGLTRGAIK